MIQIKTIDTQYILPNFAASYLLVDDKKACFIETNTTHALPHLLNTLKSANLKAEDVEYIIITHVHLDHAGGVSAAIKAFPHAKVVCHPRASRHVIDPTKLIQSASAVYGEKKFAELYGKIESVPQDKVISMEDQDSLSFGSGHLKFIHTRGHANHHFCILHQKSSSIFTGDSFGVCYPQLQEKGLFIFPSTSPTDFDADLAIESIHKIANSHARTAYLTHYGPVIEIEKSAQQLKQHLNYNKDLLNKVIEDLVTSPDTHQNHDSIKNELVAYYRNYLANLGWTWNQKIENFLDLDLDINAQGLLYAAKKKASAPSN